MAERITDRLVKGLTAPPKGNKVYLDDEVRGFGVRITAKGARSFILAYRFDDPAVQRRSNEYRATIGTYPTWSVAAARDEAKRWRQKIDRGETHPLAERREAKALVRQARQAETYRDAVADYIQREQLGRRNNSTAGEVERVLLKEGAPWLDLPVASIAATDIRRLLEDIRDGNAAVKARPYLANRTHAYLSSFFRWCAEPGIEKVPVSPMLGLRRPWEGEEARERFYTDDEIKLIWAAADAAGSVGGAFVKLLLLTGKRKGALSAMRWGELGEDGVWTPPADSRRRKRNKRVHAVPLPPLALRILSPLKPSRRRADAEDFVFPGRVRGTHLYAGQPLQKKII
ncbi:MAG: integrase family protein, partial [Pseudomonadota bacterium]